MAILDHFKGLTDFRVKRTKRYELEEVLFITIAAVICGARGWNDIENYGKSKHDWLKGFLSLPEGIPSHDTFNRIFSMLDPDELEKCFLDWVKEIANLTSGEVVSIDGKSLRGSKKKGSKSIVHMVSAWAGTNGLVLGQVKVDEKSNEITAIPELLKVLVLKGCIVTIDAMGCQTKIANKIISKEADYLLAVKGNQKSLEQSIKDTARLSEVADEWEEIDCGHGRIEVRNCKVYTDLSHVAKPEKWKSLRCLVEINASRTHKSDGKVEIETRYYITSLEPDAKKIGQSVRAHWGIENSLHWVLDVAFDEDKSRKRKGNAAQNFSVINRIALNMLKKETSKKRSIKGKQLDAGWDNDYLLKILLN